ncbi:MAG: transporter [Proteobacteria bacterium]|nr:MAG: transporter [Pseudomonadota bacterium]
MERIKAILEIPLTSLVKKLFVFSALVVVSPNVWAQTSVDIQSSRPGAAIGSNVVGSKFFQAETGYQRLKERGAEDGGQDTWVSEFRYGLTERLELTSEFDIETERTPGLPNDTGISDVEIGLKYLLITENDGLMPAFSARGRVQLPGGQGSNFQKTPSPNLIFASSWSLSDELELEADIGLRVNPDKGSSEGFGALNLTGNLSDRIALFLEGFHTFEDETGNVELDAGIGFLLTHNLQIDASAGWGEHDGTTETLISAGLSWRMPTGF